MTALKLISAFDVVPMDTTIIPLTVLITMKSTIEDYENDFVTITLDNNHADQAHHNHGQYLHFHHDQRHHHDLLFPDLPPDCLTLQLWRDAKEVEKGLPPTKVIMMVPRWW